MGSPAHLPFVTHVTKTSCLLIRRIAVKTNSRHYYIVTSPDHVVEVRVKRSPLALQRAYFLGQLAK